MYEVLAIGLCMAREEKAPQGAFSVPGCEARLFRSIIYTG